MFLRAIIAMICFSSQSYGLAAESEWEAVLNQPRELKLIEPSIYPEPAPVLSADLQSVLNARLEEIKADPKPWGYVLEEPRIRRALMCHKECVCLAARLMDTLKEKAPANLKVLNVLLQTRSGISLIDRPRLYWTHHNVLFVIRDRKIGVIDYLVFGDLVPRPYSQWQPQFVHNGVFMLTLRSYE